jgi:ubiquinone/menaquinone biosynthesis C-methylase UbiE
MQVNPTDHVLHLSFDDEAYGRADIFCGMFNKRQVANKTYKPIDYSTSKLPFKDKTFDFVYSTNILAYAHQPESMFEEIKRVAKRAHIKERSEFAEMIFGWEQTRWIIDVEDKNLIIKSKNQLKISRFGPFFHHLYATDPVFFDYCSQNPGLFNVAVDWDESDDIVDEIEKEVEEFVVPTSEEKPEGESSLFDNIDLGQEQPVQDSIPTVAETRKVMKKIKVVKTLFRPCQLEFFDNVRIVLGEISDKIDVRNLKNKNLQ